MNTSPTSTRSPLIALTIDLGNRRQDRIGIYKDTDPYAEASKFVQRNHLNQKMIPVIYNSIIKQMKAYDEMVVTVSLQSIQVSMKRTRKLTTLPNSNNSKKIN